MSQVQSFPPIASKRSKVLILDSMPGVASLKAGQYYAHPRNAFWYVMGELFGAGPSLPYQDRIARLQSVGIALWECAQGREAWTRRSRQKWPTNSGLSSVITRTSRMCFSTGARRRQLFAATFCQR